ncbi:Leucine aminopeptidase 1 [Orchesella cincta]|uniref:Leucine aminopeptidase 1 n=1 Tax=Orchesella cincta TaxID=48709 RepID=A0A1D2MTF6_ORCCI|nr:Leucine aminopeptidase 1 [Orchesella cincta]
MYTLIVFQQIAKKSPVGIPLFRTRHDVEAEVEQDGKGWQYERHYTYPDQALQQNVIRDKSEAWLIKEVKVVLARENVISNYVRSIKDQKQCLQTRKNHSTSGGTQYIIIPIAEWSSAVSLIWSPEAMVGLIFFVLRFLFLFVISVLAVYKDVRMDFKLLLIISLTISLVNGEGSSEGKRLMKPNLTIPAKLIRDEENKQVARVRRKDAATILEDVDDSATVLVPKAPIFIYKYRNTTIHQDVIHPMIFQLDMSRLEQTVKRLSQFRSRYAGDKNGLSGAEGWLRDQIKSIIADYPAFKAFTIPDSTLNQKTEGKPELGRPYYQENIIVTLEGHDPALKSELIILGAHYDSVYGFKETEWKANQPAPGADDNATGVAVLLEFLRLIAKSGIKMKHTIEFHFYTAKEEELRGSQDVVKKYKKEGKKVKGMLNLDSLGYRPNPYPGSKHVGGIVIDDAHFGTSHTDASLQAFVKMLSNHYLDVQFQIKHVSYRQGWFSDHYSWHLEGFPSAFVTEWETNTNVHRDDDWRFVNIEIVNEFAKLGLAYLIELGELSEMPVTTPSWSANQYVELSLFGACLFLNFWIAMLC